MQKEEYKLKEFIIICHISEEGTRELFCKIKKNKGI